MDSRYPDVMRIQEERERLEKLKEKYPIIGIAERISYLLEELKDPLTTEIGKDITANRLKALIYG